MPLDPNVRFIHPIAFVTRFQVRAAALIQFRAIDLDPAPDTAGVDEQATFDAISGMCANEIGNFRYHRTHHRIMCSDSGAI